MKFVILSILVGIIIITIILILVCVRKHKPAQDTYNYSLVKDWKGVDLDPTTNNGWNFFVGSDPTHGVVTYGAWTDLLVPQGDKLKISVGPPGVLPRKSIRINSSPAYTFDHGLFVAKMDHMPEGLGVWPALWLNGDKLTPPQAWPCKGEIDIIEGVNSVGVDSSYNRSSLHTNPGCNQPQYKKCTSLPPTEPCFKTWKLLRCLTSLKYCSNVLQTVNSTG